MDPYAIAAIASFIRVGLKSWQQLAVFHMEYRTIIPVSMLLSACELYMVYAAVTNGSIVVMVLVVGISSGLGSMASMWLHQKWSKS